MGKENDTENVIMKEDQQKGGGIGGKARVHHCEFATITTSLYGARNMISMMMVAMMIATMVVEWQAKCLTSNLVSEPKNNVKSHNVCVLCCRCHQKNAFLDTAAKTLTGTLTVGYNNGDEKTTEDDDDDNNNNKKSFNV